VVSPFLQQTSPQRRGLRRNLVDTWMDSRKKANERERVPWGFISCPVRVNPERILPRRVHFIPKPTSLCVPLSYSYISGPMANNGTGGVLRVISTFPLVTNDMSDLSAHSIAEWGLFCSPSLISTWAISGNCCAMHDTYALTR